MNKIATLAIISIVTAGFAAAQPANAGPMEGGARFNFQPNVWGSEKAPKVTLRATTPVHSVRNGMVPRSLLGVDPSMLARPVAPVTLPVPQTQVAATPSFGTATPSIATPSKFNSSFGKPTAPAPVVAQAPAQVAKAAPPLVVKPAANTHSSSDVAGKLAHHPTRTHSAGNGILAHAGSINPVASYGQDFGYKPGGFNPASIGGGRKTTATVSGTLISHY